MSHPCAALFVGLLLAGGAAGCEGQEETELRPRPLDARSRQEVPRYEIEMAVPSEEEDEEGPAR